MNEDVDIDEATLEVIRTNDAKLKRLQAEIDEATGDDERRLIREFLDCAKRQEAVLSEVPGLEVRARAMGEVRLRAEDHYGL